MLNLSSADMSTQLLRQSQSLVDPVDGGHAGPSNATTVKPPGHGRTGQIVAKLLDKRIGALHLDSEMMIEKPNFVPPSNEVPLNAPSLFYDGPASTPSLDMLYANILPQKRQFDWSSTDIMSDSRPVDRVRELPSPLGAESAPSPSFPSSLDNTSSGTFEQDLTAVQDFFTASLATLAPTTNQNTSTDMIPSTTTAHKASRNGTKKK